MSAGATDVVLTLTERLQPLELAVEVAWWDAATHAGDDTERRRVEAEVAYTDALADPDAFAAVRDARAGNGAEPLVARQLDILHDAFAPNQVASDLRQETVELRANIESTFSAHRGTVHGEPVDDNTIAHVLRSSTDVGERKAVWEASKTVGAAVADRVRRLAHLRNQAARDLGHRDHFSLTLATTELDEARLFATLDEVDALTASTFTGWKASLDDALAQQYGCAKPDLRPWHYDDPFFQQAPRLVAVDLDPYFDAVDLAQRTIRTYEGLGLDVGGIVERSDLTPRAGKNQHAFCIDIDRAGDVRVLCNNVPNEQWMETMLHEFGHGVYFDAVDRSLPWLLRTMHALTTEGVAMLMGRLVHDRDWLRAIGAVSANDLERVAPRLADARRAQLLVFARWVLVMTNFERALYANPDADLDTHWWDLVERYQQLRRPDDRHEPDWAAKIHIASAPVYYQNYLYGELVASQLQDTLGGEGALVDRAESGRTLVERFFRPGASLRWDHLIEHATGEPLSARAFARQLAQ
ncbi:MAG: Peptidase family [Actinomycetia bacterium]|nr:Peptidase family [Actinomycetes bacterium]